MLIALSYLLSGIFMKISDDEYDLRNNTILAIIFGVLCSLFSGFLAIFNVDACYIFIAILIGNIFALKIDGIHHLISAIVFILICIIFGIPSISIPILIICILSAFFDEVGHDFIDKFTNNKIIINFFEYRFLMKVIILLLCICSIFNIWTFVYFILFEISYTAVDYINKLN